MIESLPENDASDDKSVKICEEKTFESFLAFLYLEDSDRTNYGSLLTGLNTQQSLGNNQYPKSVTEANNVLSNHKLENSAKFKKENEDTKSKQKIKKEREEAKEQEVILSFAQMEGKCYCCGKPGHQSPTCCFLKTNQEKNGKSININRALHSQMGPQTNQQQQQQYQYLSLHHAIKFLKHQGQKQDGLGRILALRNHVLCKTGFFLITSQV
jgi:hypothetical protein